jgi:C4-dicarboxylate transporter
VIGLVVCGVVGYVLLEGVVAGLALFVAGLLLMAVGVWGWHDRR